MKICKIKDCDIRVLAKDYCDKHYTRFRRHGNPFHVENERHGMTGTSEYITWYNMIHRCYNGNNTGYKYYGERGITVCDRWRKSFKAFYVDMGKKPFPKAEIDRINNDLGYFPRNCRWATRAQNQQNKRNNKLSFEKATHPLMTLSIFKEKK
ncbi:hypothetical protein LCGC14_2046290 [marine sediment metagenome]|uniref:Nuclease associated modular domain-containing protein n=1 Tax=marine sediment metagenome TaxID=412755 RepID=A0A0F9H3V1_9ZZZZ